VLKCGSIPGEDGGPVGLARRGTPAGFSGSALGRVYYELLPSMRSALDGVSGPLGPGQFLTQGADTHTHGQCPRGSGVFSRQPASSTLAGALRAKVGQRRAPARHPERRTTLYLKTSKPRTLPQRCDVRANARRAFARVAIWAAALTWCRLPAEWRRHARALLDFLAVARPDQPRAPPPFPAHNSKHRRRRRFHLVRRGSQVGPPH